MREVSLTGVLSAVEMSSYVFLTMSSPDPFLPFFFSVPPVPHHSSAYSRAALPARCLADRSQSMFPLQSPSPGLFVQKRLTTGVHPTSLQAPRMPPAWDANRDRCPRKVHTQETDIHRGKKLALGAGSYKQLEGGSDNSKR